MSTAVVAHFDRRAGVYAALICVVVLAATLMLGARAASGADSLGYVSQAYLWLGGGLRIDQPLIAEAPWPHREASLAPLGYRPGRGISIVPTYSSGLPLIMAGFALVLGACGPYLVSPVCALIVLGATFGLAARLTGDRLIALAACALMATSPVFLFHSMLPMSDVPTAALWALSFCALTWRGAAPALSAGVAAGLAILVRPNLAPLALAGVAAAALWADEGRRSAMRRVAAYLAFGVVLSVIAVALLNQHLHGAPLRSGYGETRDLYSLAFLPTNVRRVAGWLIGAEGAVLGVALAALFLSRPRVDTRTSMPAILLVAIVVASYLFYLPQTGWIYLRFLLPVFPFLMIGTALLIVRAARARPAVAGLLLAATGALAVARLSPHLYEIRSVGRGEDRYVAAADFIERALPPEAVFVSMQHSGTIAYYAGRSVVRYDWLRGGSLEGVVEWLHRHGRRPYIVLDGWEEPHFRRRFAQDGEIGRLALRVVGEVPGQIGVRIYDPLEPTPYADRPFQIPIRRRCAGPSQAWATGLWYDSRSEDRDGTRPTSRIAESRRP